MEANVEAVIVLLQKTGQSYHVSPEPRYRALTESDRELRGREYALNPTVCCELSTMQIDQFRYITCKTSVHVFALVASLLGQIFVLRTSNLRGATISR